MSRPASIKSDSTGDPAAASASSPASSNDDGDPDSCPDVPIVIDVVIEVSDVGEPVASWLETMTRRAAVLAGVRSGVISIALVDDARMTDMHREYMDIDKTTDVLTFDLMDRDDDDVDGSAADAQGCRVEGDIAVCVDEARRQATLRGHELDHELLLYAVHGMLHLVGFDDLEPEQAAAMHAMEDDLLTRLGVGRIFGREARDASCPDGTGRAGAAREPRERR